MDGSRGGKAISSNKNILFSLWFHLINLRCPGINMCGDNQGIIGKKKADETDEADGSGAGGGGADAEKPDGADRVDGTGGGGVDTEEPDGANRVDRAD